MRKIKDYKFQLSVSREGYRDKNEATKCLTSYSAKQINKSPMAFKEQSLTADDLLLLANNGHSFCYLYNLSPDDKYLTETKINNITYPKKQYAFYQRGENKGYFKLKFKTLNHFIGTQTIFVDVDYTSYETIYDYLDKLSYKPTLLYTSFSDATLKGGVWSRRFRLVYVFDEVLDIEKFTEISNNIYKMILVDTEDIIEDKCWLNANQYYNGGCFGCETYKSDYIYSAEDFSLDNLDYIFDDIEDTDLKQSVTVTSNISNIEWTTTTTDIVVNYNFSSDLMSMDSLTFRKIYGQKYRYIFKTTYDDYIDGLYQFTDDNYYSLYYNREKIKDGQHRRKKLFILGATRRLIKPDITVEELIYNLYIDREKFIDNSDDVVNNEFLLSTGKEIMKMTDEEIKSNLPEQKRPKFTVNHTLNKYEKRKAVSVSRGLITERILGELMDLSVSVDENIKTLNKLGYSYKKSTVYNFLKKHGHKDVKEKQLSIEDIDLKKSIRENLILLKEKGINTTYYQVQKMIKNNVTR